MSTTPLAQWVAWTREGAPSWLSEKRGLPPPEPLPAHVGLFLDRYLVERADGEQKDHPGRQSLFHAAVAALRPGTPAVRTYQEVFERWQAGLASAPGLLRRTLELTARSRLLLHPETAGTVTESALLLHHSYGVPYLPGSALKGLCRAWARHLARRGGSLPVNELLGAEPARGDTEEGGAAGVLDFWDALWIPEPRGDFSPLMLDVVNPHHRDYYTADTHPPPAPSDEPVPTHFLTVRPGARFLLVLEAPDSEGGALVPWLDAALGWLCSALAEWGIGAKTSAGYGRLEGPRAPGPRPGRSAAAPMPVAQEEVLAFLSRHKGDGSLVATSLTDRSVARAQGEAARALHGALSDETRRRLDRGKEVRVRVVVEVEGNMRRLVAIREG